MSDRLVGDPDAVSALAGRVSDATGLPVTQVEKDFWVTEVLRGVSATADQLGVEVLFKGGTSLSKVFGMIERFSEDVDMLVIFGAGAKRAREETLKSLIAGASAATGLDAVDDPSTATTGVKRSARFHCPMAHGVGPGLSEGVLLELGSRGGGVGAARAEVESLIVRHLPQEIAGAPEAAPVASTEDRPEGGFAASPAFTDGPHVDAVRVEYERRVLGELLWPDAYRPTFDECVDVVRERAADL